MGAPESLFARTINRVIKFSQFIMVILLIMGTILFLIVRGRVDRQTRRISEELRTLYNDQVVVEIVLGESIPIELSIPISDLVDLEKLIPAEMPFNAVVPINTEVDINQILEVPLNLPIVGPTVIDVPINTTVPLDMEIPVSTVITIDPSAIGDPDYVVDLSQELPANIPFIVNISPSELGMAPQIASLADFINTLRLVFLLPEVELDLSALEEEQPDR